MAGGERENVQLGVFLVIAFTNKRTEKAIQFKG